MGEKKFDVESLLEISNQVAKDSELIDLHTFNDEMTISQVVRFFAKHDCKFTKTMIQNYIRVGVLPPPIEKRYYTRNHLVLLSLIYRLKSIYSLEEIKEVFLPILRDTATFDDDMIEVMDLYTDYMTLHEHALKDWETYLPDRVKQASQMIEENQIDDKEKDTAAAFMLVLTLMAQTIAMKDLVGRITKKYLMPDNE